MKTEMELSRSEVKTRSDELADERLARQKQEKQLEQQRQ